MESLRRGIRRLGHVAVAVYCLAQATVSIRAAEPPLSESSQRLATARMEAGPTPDILSRVRQATWQLLVGELAGHQGVGLPSGSYDELTNGLQNLDRLLVDLKDQPQLERDLTKHLQLTMRFDAMQARRATLEKAREVSRADELQRLHQLRQINRAYRDLIQNLMQLQTSQVLGQPADVAKLGNASTTLMAEIEDVVGQRRDFYLFQDEPPLGMEADSELKLIRAVAQPLAGDVRRHQLSLQA